VPNPAVNYIRQFEHKDWIDNQDRVEAGGTNGFNARFHGLETELDKISGVITAISAALDALGQAPPPSQTKLALAPTLVPTSAVGWSHLSGRAEKPAGQTSAHGMMALFLPNGITLQTLRASGRVTGAGNLRISIQRQGLTIDAPAAERVAHVEPAGDPYDISGAADAAFAKVDTERFKYFLLADLDNAAAADIVQILAFQITFLASR
jgi:hypothetical protein